MLLLAVLVVLLLFACIIPAVRWAISWLPEWTHSQDRVAWASCAGFVEEMYGLPISAAKSYHAGIVVGQYNVFRVTLHYPKYDRTIDCAESYDEATRTWHFAGAQDHK